MGARSLVCYLNSLARLALGCFILCCAAAAFGQAEGLKVEKIEVQGLTTYRPAQILLALKVKTGQPFSSIDSRADLNYLGHLMRTAQIHTDPTPSGGVAVTYIVSEFPRFRQLQVVGNQKMTTKRIEGLARIKAGDPIDMRVQDSLLRTLRKEYAADGMPQAQVGINIIDVPADPKAKNPGAQADLQIMINEGKQVLCRKLVFKGNQAFGDTRLKFHVNTKGSFGFIKNYYDEKVFRDDLAELQRFYAYEGYFDAKVERGVFEEVPGEKVATITPVIQITEGRRYKIGSVTLRGVRLISQDDAMEPFKPLLGKLFDGKKFSEALIGLRDMYQDLALLTTDFETKYDYLPNQVLNVTVEVTEGECIHVGKIKLVRPPQNTDDQGSKFFRWYQNFSPPVKEDAILREVLLKPGEVYNRRLERDSMRRLADLGVFKEDTLKAHNEPTGEAGVHNVVIEAEDADTGIIMGGVGYGDVAGAFLFANFNEQNVGGEANNFSIQGMLGTRQSSLVTSYLDRHLHGGENSLLTRFYIQTQVNPGYDAQTIGATTEWGHPLTPEWNLYLRPRLEWVHTNKASGVHHTKEDLNQSYGVATGRIRAVEDTRYPFGPGNYREGHLQAYGVEAGYAGGPLVRLEAQRDQYIPINNWLTYRVNAFGGIMPYSREVVPVNERYFLGGDTDLRGFKYHGAGYFDSDNKNVPIGGAAKVLVKNELHYPIYDPISGVAFVDVGTLAKDPASWQMPRASAGVGVRFQLQKVQVALDFAAPIITQSHDQTRFFHFSLESKLPFLQ